MASLLQTLEALLDPLVDTVAPGGIFLGENPNDPLPLATDGTVQPYATWQDIVTVDNVCLDGATGLQPTRIQVEIFAPRRTDAESIRIAVDAALAPLSAVPISRTPKWETLVKLWRITRDFNISFDESAP